MVNEEYWAPGIFFTHHSPLTTLHSPFTIHHSPFTLHHFPVTIPRDVVFSFQNDDFQSRTHTQPEVFCNENDIIDHARIESRDRGNSIISIYDNALRPRKG